MKLEDTPTVKTEPEENELVGVLPRTLGVRALRKTNDKGEVVNEIAGVYGGRSANVWVASFADVNEAQAFILASNYMGQMVRGIVIPDIAVVSTDTTAPEVVDGSGKDSGEPTPWGG
jgi:hypothetical protein